MKKILLILALYSCACSAAAQNQPEQRHGRVLLRLYPFKWIWDAWHKRLPEFPGGIGAEYAFTRNLTAEFMPGLVWMYNFERVSIFAPTGYQLERTPGLYSVGPAITLSLRGYVHDQGIKSDDFNGIHFLLSGHFQYLAPGSFKLQTFGDGPEGFRLYRFGKSNIRHVSVLFGLGGAIRLKEYPRLRIGVSGALGLMQYRLSSDFVLEETSLPPRIESPRTFRFLGPLGQLGVSFGFVMKKKE